MRQWPSILIRVLMLAAYSWPWISVRSEEGATRQEYPEVRLCDALEAVSYGDRLLMKVSGIYQVSAEISMLYDPEQPLCRLDVQPSTWVEFAPTAVAESPTLYENIRRLTTAPKRVLVTFEGELWGPGSLGDDDPAAPVMIAYANRVAYQRYGHNNAFRTKLVVHSIHFAEAVWNSDIETGVRHRPKGHESFPAIKDAKVPAYPARAQLAGIEGRVIVDVRVENGAIVNTTVLSGDRILAPDTLANIETWQFESEVSTSFITTFIYRLELRMTHQSQFPKIVLELPERVTIIGAANGW